MPSQSEDLLWNDYEEKLSDQVVRTMENYTSQFPEVKVTCGLREFFLTYFFLFSSHTLMLIYMYFLY